MPASVAEFAKAAEDSGILTAESLAEYLQGVALNTDATALANRLVKDGRLTAFQAKYIYGGKANSLVLGPYVVLDMLGKGGMGYVYKAEHRKMRRVVALKVIAKTALKSPAAVRRFEREVQAAARLEHPNIVTAHDAGEAAGTHYLVMQFVDGRNLSEVVKELGPQPVGRAVDWILQAARGLAYAHGKGVVHRDIKPGNLLIDQDGAVKILDMGLARLETLDADQDQLTGTGQIMGTVDYMAPEQAMDTRQADARSDVYSLGVTLWYLLAGRPLFEADSVVKKIMAHQQKPAPSLADASVAADPRLDAVFQRMVAKQPAERFQSMQEVIAALQSLPQSETVAGPPSVDFRGGPVSLGPLATEATQTLQQPKVVTANEDTARLSSINVDTDLGLKKVSAKPQRTKSNVKPLHLAIGGGAVGVLLLVGLMMFAFGGRREPKTVGQGGESAAQPTSRLDAVASVAIAEPTAPPRTEPKSTAPPPAARSTTPPPPAIAPFDATQARKHQETWAKHLGIEVETTNSIGQTLVVIPPGRFTMGEGDKTVDVTLTKPFLLGQTEVTQGQWKAVMGTDTWNWQGARAIRGTDVAASFVTWEAAVAFCEKLTERERGQGRISDAQEYRLPTDAEWEFACRAGTMTAFSFGADASLLGEHAWYGGGWRPGVGWKDGPIPGGNTATEMHAHAVRLKRPNPFGLSDAHGNVWEWVSDWYGELPKDEVTDPLGPPDGSVRVLRGGSWIDDETKNASASRERQRPDHRGDNNGFRIALSLSTTPPIWTARPKQSSAAPPPAIAPFDATQARKHQEAWAKHLGIEVETTNSIGQTLVVIPPGRFTMGEGDKTVDVTLTKPFLLGQTEVTQGQWKEVMGTELWKGKAFATEGDDVGASYLLWEDASRFCMTLTSRERASGGIGTDEEYRLPTEAEWEYACRAGTVTKYWFGDDDDSLGEYAWFGGGWDGKSPIPGGNTRDNLCPRIVAQKKPNPWRLFDILGNQWEWCLDWQGNYPEEPVTDPRGPTAGTVRVYRGGAWDFTPTACRSAHRNLVMPGVRYSLGCRIVRSVSTPGAETLSNRLSPHPGAAARNLAPSAPPPAVAPFDALQASKHQEAWAKHFGIEVETTNSIGQKLVVIPPGRFTMGEGDKTVDVTLTKPFLLGQTEVTQGQWKEVMGSELWKGQEYTTEGTDVAATFVSWDDAVAFCEKLTARERGSERINREQAYRLPTEAEWEFACRAGTVTAYSFGDDEGMLGNYAWFGGGLRDGTPIPGGSTAGEMYAQAVGVKRPNPFGLFDLHGNAWEWVADWRADYAKVTVTDPRGPDAGVVRVGRGGCWYYPASISRSAYRNSLKQSFRCDALGFRVALSPLGVEPVPPEAGQ